MKLFIYLQDRFLKAKKSLSEFWTNIVSILKTGGKKHNAFFPITLFCVLLGCIFAYLIVKETDEKVKMTLIYALIGLVGFGCLMYLLFWLFKIDRLHSESYLIEDTKLRMIAKKGSGIIINPVDLTTPPTLNEGGRDA